MMLGKDMLFPLWDCIIMIEQELYKSCFTKIAQLCKKTSGGGLKVKKISCVTCNIK
jgi:hypothetical protein